MVDKPNVLFVCVYNAGRSKMAAGWLAHLAGDRIEVHSAGKRYEDWKLDDPAGHDIEAVRVIRDQIRTRVENLMSELA